MLKYSWEAVHKQSSEERNLVYRLHEGGPTSCPLAQRGVSQTTKANSTRPGTFGNRSGSTSESGVFLKPRKARQEVLELGPGVCKQHPGATQQHSE